LPLFRDYAVAACYDEARQAMAKVRRAQKVPRTAQRGGSVMRRSRVDCAPRGRSDYARIDEACARALMMHARREAQRVESRCCACSDGAPVPPHARAAMPPKMSLLSRAPKFDARAVFQRVCPRLIVITLC